MFSYISSKDTISIHVSFRSLVNVSWAGKPVHPWVDRDSIEQSEIFLTDEPFYLDARTRDIYDYMIFPAVSECVSSLRKSVWLSIELSYNR